MNFLHKSEKGFTLVETIIVLAVIGAIVSFGSIVDLNTFKRDALRSEEATILSALEKARSRSMSNIMNTYHGVCYEGSNYIIFRGRTSCLPASLTDETIPANINIAVTFPTVVVFEQLSGKLTPELVPPVSEIDISITDGIRSDTIKINNEGTINW